jgi:hypothetical protein
MPRERVNIGVRVTGPGAGCLSGLSASRLGVRKEMSRTPKSVKKHSCNTNAIQFQMPPPSSFLPHLLPSV